MKKLLVLSLTVALLTACGSKTEQKVTEQTSTSVSSSLPTLDVEKVLATGENLLDKEIILKGVITHTCKHSGKRCFVVGADGKTSLRVEAKGNIGGFNKELVGSEVAITGILKGNKLTKEYIDQQEKDVNFKKVKEDGSAESCEIELNNIANMKKWMADNNKDFYIVYYVDGLSYDVVE